VEDVEYRDQEGRVRKIQSKQEMFAMQIIKSVGVLSVAKIMGALYAVLGLIAIPFFLLAGLVGSMVPNQSGQNPFAGFGIVFALMAPIFYGVLGFIFGAIGAFLYNLLAKWIGGIELHLQSSAIPTIIGQPVS